MADVDNRGRVLRDADHAVLGVAEDAVVQQLAATFARDPIGVAGLRDAKLTAFLLALQPVMGQLTRRSALGGHVPVVLREDELVRQSGMTRPRVEMAIARLIRANVLERVQVDSTTELRFNVSVLSPAGSVLQVDWSRVQAALAGRMPALLILSAVLESVRLPWEWTALTYEGLARQALYSVGMAQRGVAQLISTGVLERSVHAGRGHDYRLTGWSLGRGAVQPGEPPATSAPIARAALEAERVPVLPTPPTVPRAAGETATMAVEIGGIVVRVPSGTEIRMMVHADGTPYYEVGPDMRISRRP